MILSDGPSSFDWTPHDIDTMIHADDRLPSPAHLRTLLLALRGSSTSTGSDSGSRDRAALAKAIVEELRAWGQVR